MQKMESTSMLSIEKKEAVNSAGGTKAAINFDTIVNAQQV